jgi:hypothetical protein
MENDKVCNSLHYTVWNFMIECCYRSEMEEFAVGLYVYRTDK